MNSVHYSHLSDHYCDLNSYLKIKYGEKVVKVCLDGGFSCPNRDGTCGENGCIFCSERGAGEYLERSKSIADQFSESCKRAERKRKANKFIAYFQNYTGTYDLIENLEKKYYAALSDSRVVVLAIATRPDCINDQIIDLLSKIKNEKNVDIWIELGLQTIHDKTAEMINRGYKTAVFFDAVNRLRKSELEVIVHLMMGLPGETEEDMIESVNILSQLDIQGIKFHNVNVMKNTKLEELYLQRRYYPIELNKYINVLAESIMRLPKNIVVHRLVSDCNPNYLVAPHWAKDKYLMLTEVARKFVFDNVFQGAQFNNNL